MANNQPTKQTTKAMNNQDAKQPTKDTTNNQPTIIHY